MERHIVNARIADATLGFQDHGIFTADIVLEWPGFGCHFGGYSFGGDKPDSASGFAGAYIQRLLRAVGVLHWDDLKGQYVRIETGALYEGIYRIGHIVEDRWFDPRALVEEFEK